MKNLRRIIAALLTATFVLTAFCACNGGTGNDATSEPDTTAAPTPDNSTAPDPETTVPETTETTAPAPAVLTPRDKSAKYRVLFIGNSFTYYNDMNKPNGIF